MSLPLVEPAGPRPTLAAVVVTFDRLAQLQVTVARLLADDVDHVVVVDNASTDGTAAYLAGVADPRLHVIRTPVNIGGAGGFELGLGQVVARHDPDWCVVMDDDARPAPGALARFRAEAGGFDAWEALAAGVYYPDGAICEMNRPSRNPFWHLAAFARTLFGAGRKGFHVTDDAYQAQTVQPIDVCSFVGFFLSRRAIARAGLPDGKLFIYGDDVLYTLKLSRRGGTIGFAPWLRFEHDCSTLSRGGEHIHRPMWKAYYNYRNGLLAYHAAAGLWFWPALLLILPKWLAKARFYDRDWAVFLKLLGVAMLDALRGKLDRSHGEILALSQGAPPAR